MSFGISYSIQTVDPIDWVHTKLSKRIIRGFLGVGISLGFYELMHLIKPTDQKTVFIVHKVTVVFVSSFFIYGLFPILCSKINLVDSGVQDFIFKQDQMRSPSAAKDDDEVSL